MQLPNTTPIRLLWQGRTRFARALFTFVAIYFSYRRASSNNKGQHLSDAEESARLHQTHTRNADRLLNLFRANGGTWIKAGQFLSARPDILPRPYIDAFQPLQNNARPLPFDRIRHTLDTQWGPGWRAHFISFCEIPIASASNSQVYKAQHADGRWLAIKVMNPDVRALSAQDFTFYRLASQLLAHRLRPIDLPHSMNVFLDTLATELDFRQEARNIATFCQLDHIPGIRSLTLVPDLCNDEIIVTEWIEGQSLVPFLQSANHATQIKVLSLLQDSFIQQVIRFGIFQGDPHPGNYIVDNHCNIYLIDFGFLGRLSDRQRLNYIKLIMAILDGNADALQQTLIEGGFLTVADNLFSEKLLQLLKSIGSTALSDINLDEVEELLTEILDSIRTQGTQVPAHYLITGRVFLTLMGLCKLFNVIPDNINLRNILAGKTAGWKN